MKNWGPLEVTIEFLGPISNHTTICEPIHEAFDDQPTESVEICLQVSTFNDILGKTFLEKVAYNFQAQMTYNINFLNSPHMYFFQRKVNLLSKKNMLVASNRKP